MSAGSDVGVGSAALAALVAFYGVAARPLSQDNKRRRQRDRDEKLLMRGRKGTALESEIKPLPDRLVAIETDVNGLAIGQKHFGEMQEALTQEVRELAGIVRSSMATVAQRVEENITQTNAVKDAQEAQIERETA